MKIKDLRIGDTVRDKVTKFPMKVVAIFSHLNAPDTEGSVYLDFDGNEGDVWEEEIKDIEFVKKAQST